MVDTKLIILITPIMLAGCATVPAPVVMPEEVKEVREVAVEPPVISAEATPLPAKLAELSSSSAAVEKIEKSVVAASNDVPIAQETKVITLKKKEKLIDKVTNSIMNTAEAAIADKKETITYDSNGGVKEKTIEVNKGSFVENMTKLFGLLSATLGLYIGVKKFRQPDLRKV